MHFQDDNLPAINKISDSYRQTNKNHLQRGSSLRSTKHLSNHNKSQLKAIPNNLNINDLFSSYSDRTIRGPLGMHIDIYV